MKRDQRSITRRTAREELAVIVSDALRAESINAVLVGGSVVAIYSQGLYVTDDLDFVSYRTLKQIAPPMERLGFAMTGNRAFHPRTALYVQFCAPPLAVGREPVTAIERKTAHGVLALLSPTDCVIDRLMKYYHWNDEQGLEQALLVVAAQPVDLDRIRQVSMREGQSDKLMIFERRANPKPG